MSTINALVLHRITEGKGSRFEDVSTANLASILDSISSSFTLLREQPKTNAFPQSWFITFDDGNASDYEIALPLLRKYDVKATFFIVTSWVGKPGFMNWEQIKCMDLEGMQIGSHSVSHKEMTKIPNAERINEFISSRKIIEDHLGKMVNAFAFPFGLYNAATIKEVFESGYEFCCTSRHGIFSQEERTIPRNSINGSMSMKEIGRVLNANHGIRARWLLEDTFKLILRLTLKIESYQKIRNLFAM